MKIVDYCIASAWLRDDSLVERVRSLIKQGWQPYGRPYATTIHGQYKDLDKTITHQAMVKYEETDTAKPPMPSPQPNVPPAN